MTEDRDGGRLAIAEFEEAMGEILQDTAMLDELSDGIESRSPFALDMLPPRVRRPFTAALSVGVQILPEPFDKVSFLLGLFLGCRIAGRVYEEEQA